ncbi:hypothetical protein [Planctomicrobium piriforme]|uniref:Uncharacterized protein n=1 Tax=Planctomicrobium piriforme TaxID=1576369 RepID=A0A1I3G2N4_9PLAN|nr:hypothetical protein [Planctomicrobium piriforme]SFI17748.1 hypothetical protein SAMN05421753_106149 [Planctomicrobium piriforme]
MKNGGEKTSQPDQATISPERAAGRARSPLMVNGMRLLCGLLLTAAVGPQQGCINTLVMAGKVLMGDPTQKSGYEMATGTCLKKEEKRILIHCTAPATVAAGYDTLTSDVEEELIRRLKRHELKVLHPDVAAKTLDRLGGTFDPQALARDVKDMDIVFHVRVEQFSYKEESSPNFYRGNANGRIVGYEIREEGDSRHAVQVFDQRFHATYPTTYPVAVDQTPQNVFIRRFIDHIADALGASFYDVNRSSLYAN